MDYVIENWNISLKLANFFSQRYSNSFLNIKFEEMITEKSDFLDRAFNFVNLEREGEKIIMDYSEKHKISFSSKPVGKWKSELSNEEIAYLTPRMEPFLKLNGYEV